MTLSLVLLELPDGRWMAKCDQFPYWHVEGNSHDELSQSAEDELRALAAEHLQISKSTRGTVPA